MRDADIQEAFPISKSRTSPRLLNGTHYREIAHGLRKLAHQCRFVASRRELLELAASFDRRAEYFDGQIR